MLASVLISSAALKWRVVGPAAREEAATRLRTEAERSALHTLRCRLASPHATEAQILAAGGDALAALAPNAAAAAVGTFADGCAAAAPTPRIAALEVLCVLGDAPSRRALASSLPPLPGADTSLAALRAPHAARVPLLDSDEQGEGVHAFADWAHAVASGLPSHRIVTASLSAGPMIVGWLVLHADVFTPALPLAAIRELCDALGGAIFVRRATLATPGLLAPPARADRSADEARGAVPTRASFVRHSLL